MIRHPGSCCFDVDQRAFHAGLQVLSRQIGRRSARAGAGERASHTRVPQRRPNGGGSMRPLHVLGMPLPLMATGSASAAGDGVDVSRGMGLRGCGARNVTRGGAGPARRPFAESRVVAVARQPSATGSAPHAFLTTPHGDRRHVRLASGLTGGSSREGPGNLETCFNSMKVGTRAQIARPRHGEDLPHDRMVRGSAAARPNGSAACRTGRRGGSRRRHACRQSDEVPPCRRGSRAPR
jgi:hypothetical protein